MSNKLQLYFDYFAEHYDPREWVWYKTLNYRIQVIQKFKERIKEIIDFKDLEEDQKKEKLDEITSHLDVSKPDDLEYKHIREVKSFQDLLGVYLFDQDNGVGNVKQGSIWDTEDNPHKSTIEKNATPTLIYTILNSNKDEASGLISDKLLKVENDKNYEAVKYRFLRVLFPEEFVSPDAPGKFEELLKTLRTKLGVDITGNSLAEKHLELVKLVTTDDLALRQMFFWILPDMLENEINLKKALVFYGAPGTGKTFRSVITAREVIDAHRIKIGQDVGTSYAIQTVQFHPSYSYEDFFEGIRPTIEGELKLFNGAFKSFCKKNGHKELQLYKNEAFLTNPNFKNINYDFSRIKISELDADQKKILAIEDKNLPSGLTIDEVVEPAFFIIDEINRAELSKVFGELMLSLEYRGYNGKIRTQYSHLCESESSESVFFWEDDMNWFFVPQNIFIIGTMNTIDRSVDAFDFALRRRFMWEEVNVNYDVVRKELSNWGKKDWGDTLATSLQTLNDHISKDEVLDKHYQIGHAYLLELTKMNPSRLDSAQKAKEFLWVNFIQPLLEEYLRGLGDDQKAQEKIEKFKASFV